MDWARARGQRTSKPCFSWRRAFLSPGPEEGELSLPAEGCTGRSETDGALGFVGTKESPRGRIITGQDPLAFLAFLTMPAAGAGT